MAQITIIYDTLEPPLDCSVPGIPLDGMVKVARMPIADGLDNRGIYEVACRLAEMLLEQLSAAALAEPQEQAVSDALDRDIAAARKAMDAAGIVVVKVKRRKINAALAEPQER